MTDGELHSYMSENMALGTTLFALARRGNLSHDMRGLSLPLTVQLPPPPTFLLDNHPLVGRKSRERDKGRECCCRRALHRTCSHFPGLMLKAGAGRPLPLPPSLPFSCPLNVIRMAIAARARQSIHRYPKAAPSLSYPDPRRQPHRIVTQYECAPHSVFSTRRQADHE